MTDPRPAVRREIRITGQVQGVGFRPFVYRLARELGVAGTVRNDPRGVTIEAQASSMMLDALAARVRAEAPALARVDTLDVVREDAPRPALEAFEIAGSDHGPTERGRVTVDAAVCADCLREMRDPEDRRYGHALINCTNCGPRYTIVRDLPYDRPLTTMAPFPMCADCAREYADPGDRRFHAQPTCCPACGPRLCLLDGAGQTVTGDPIDLAVAILRRGGILALKGLGGFHLAVDAASEAGVDALRRGKRRDAKPFALMVRDVDAARRLVRLGADAEASLLSPERPIVLALRRDDGLASGVAPGFHRLGVMLPYTPIHHLLFDAGLGPLVMTSANHADDPLLVEGDEMTARLGSILDGTLLHDRGIERAVDDSIVLDGDRGLVPVRRARGAVPAPLALPCPSPRPGLAVGGELKNTVAVVRGGEAVLGQHLGDLTWSLAYARFERTIEDLERLFDTTPTWIACDAHPDYLSHGYARERAARAGMDLVVVQHHHAHLASLMAEHGRTAPVIGLVCDGVGYGSDGTAWGGELLKADLVSFERLGSLRPLRLPGGDAAARETARPALSWMEDLLGAEAGTHPVALRVLPDAARRRSLLGMLAADVACPTSSGLGRLFDATASLLGLCALNRTEALSGMRLEAAAHEAGRGPSGAGLLPVTEAENGLLALDTRPLLQALLGWLEEGRDTGEIAFAFHDAVAHGLIDAAARLAASTGIESVGLSGGVFLNAVLAKRVTDGLEQRGLEVLTHHVVPPGDGGLALGQAAVAAARLSRASDA